MKKQNQNKKLLVGTVIGGVVGVATSMIAYRNKERIAEKYTEVRGKAGETVEQIKGQTAEWDSQLKNRTIGFTNQLKQAVKEVAATKKNQSDEVTQEATAKLNQAIDDFIAAINRNKK